MTTRTLTCRTPISRVAAVAAVLAVALTSCGRDDGGADEESSNPIQDADTTSDGVENDADPEQVSEDAGIDVDAGGTGEVSFLGNSYVFTAAESFGCFIVEDGGSDGSIDFKGTAEDGSEIAVDWAGDSVDSASLRITIDGTEYQTGFADGPLEVSITGSAAEVSTEVGQVGVADGGSEPISGTFACS